MSSWFSPKVEKRTSPIEGRGLFARQAIAAGEIVAVKGGAIMDSAALALIRNDVSPAEIQIEDDLYIAPRTAAEVEENILCLNHSCQPNVGVRGQITFRGNARHSYRLRADHRLRDDRRRSSRANGVFVRRPRVPQGHHGR